MAIIHAVAAPAYSLITEIAGAFLATKPPLKAGEESIEHFTALWRG